MWPSFSEQTIYMSSFILWVADDEPASETEISQLQQLPAAMNEFRRTLASVWCNICTVFNWNNLLLQLSYLRFNLSPGFHSFFITYLRKLKSNSEEIDVQASAVLKILLKIPPSWSQPSAARSANQKWVIFLFVQSGSSNFARGNYQN